MKVTKNVSNSCKIFIIVWKKKLKSIVSYHRQLEMFCTILTWVHKTKLTILNSFFSELKHFVQMKKWWNDFECIETHLNSWKIKLTRYSIHLLFKYWKVTQNIAKLVAIKYDLFFVLFCNTVIHSMELLFYWLMALLMTFLECQFQSVRNTKFVLYILTHSYDSKNMDEEMLTIAYFGKNLNLHNNRNIAMINLDLWSRSPSFYNFLTNCTSQSTQFIFEFEWVIGVSAAVFQLKITLQLATSNIFFFK